MASYQISLKDVVRCKTPAEVKKMIEDNETISDEKFEQEFYEACAIALSIRHNDRHVDRIMNIPVKICSPTFMTGDQHGDQHGNQHGELILKCDEILLILVNNFSSSKKKLQIMLMKSISGYPWLLHIELLNDFDFWRESIEFYDEAKKTC